MCEIKTRLSLKRASFQQLVHFHTTQSAIGLKGTFLRAALPRCFPLFPVNAADNKQRDPKMSTIKIDIDP